MTKPIYIILTFSILLMGCITSQSGKEGSEEKTEENNQGDSSLVQPVIVDSDRYNDSIRMNSSFIPPNGIEFLIWVHEDSIYEAYPYLKFDIDTTGVWKRDIVFKMNGNTFKFYKEKSPYTFCERIFDVGDTALIDDYISYCNENYKVVSLGKEWTAKQGDMDIAITRQKFNIFYYRQKTENVIIGDNVY